MIFRIHYEQIGGHTHMQVFAGKQDGNLGKCGDLCMRNEEFAEFKAISRSVQFRDAALSATERK